MLVVLSFALGHLMHGRTSDKPVDIYLSQSPDNEQFLEAFSLNPECHGLTLITDHTVRARFFVFYMEMKHEDRVTALADLNSTSNDIGHGATIHAQDALGVARKVCFIVKGKGGALR